MRKWAEVGAVIVVAGVLVVGAVFLHGRIQGTPGAGPTAALTWPPANQVAIGNIPAATFNKQGRAYLPAPPGAQPAITKDQAIQSALNAAAQQYPTAKLRQAYLVEDIAEFDVSGKGPVDAGLEWIVDLSPDAPFWPAIHGGGPPNDSPASPGATPVPAAAQNHWMWAEVNAMDGATAVWIG